MAFLALIRHGESEWNALDLWTGWTDVKLSPKGIRECQVAAESLRGIKWDIAFESGLVRSKQTLEEIEKTLGIRLPVKSSHALDERDYGNFDGMHKSEVEAEYGEDLYQKWHRGWDYPVPHGETLKDVYERVIPYYIKIIKPHLEKGENVLISAHGNSLRALVKYLDKIPSQDIPYLEIATGEVYIYKIDDVGKVVSKKIKKPTYRVI